MGRSVLSLDVLRFIAAMGVVTLHFTFSVSTELGEAMVGLQALVDLFFVISGVVMCHAYGSRLNTEADGQAYALARVGRIMPLHLATLAFYAVVGLSGYGADPARYDWGCLPANLFLLQSAGVCEGLTFNEVSWSISAEVFMYAAFPMLLLVWKRVPWLPGLVGIAFALTLTLTDPYWWNRTWDHGYLRAIPAFLIGMTIAGTEYRIKRPGAWLAALSAAFVAAVLDRNGLAAVIASYAIVAVAVQVRSSFAEKIAPLGDLTYSIYLLHPVVMTLVFTGIGARLLGLGPVGMVVLVVASVPLLIALSCLSLRYFERPARDWFKRPRRRMSPAAT